MRKKLVLLGFFLVSLIITGLNLIPENPKQTNPIPSTTGGKRPNVFLIGAIQMEKDLNYNVKCDELKFNVWHNYVQMQDTMRVDGLLRRIPDGWYTFPQNTCQNDKLMNNDVSSYAGDVNAIISGNKTKGYWSFMERPKIEYLIRGQQSIYQCEDTANISFEKFYHFDSSKTGRSVLDSGVYVRKCEQGVDTANRYVVKDVYIKYEQTACKGANSLFFDYQYFWFVKPRIRIPTGFLDEVEVCKIEVYSFNGLKVLDKTVTAGDFKQSLVYNGEYREIYHISDPNFLRVRGDTLKANKCDSSNSGSQFDIRVKWLGNCTMWIDYVKMESDVAEQIFRTTDNSDPWITGEANLIGRTDGAYRFWVEEPDYNCLPCVKYVQDKIKSSCPDTAATLIMNDYSCYLTPQGANAKNILNYDDYKLKYNSMNMNEIVTMCFLFELHDPISNELQSGPYDPGNGYLGTPVPRTDYELGIQGILDSRLVQWQKNYAVRYSKEYPEKPLYCGVTTILNFYPKTELGFADQGSREPTNQEIEAVVNTMVSFGAKGIIYHCYDGFGSLPQSPPYTDYGRGLTNPPVGSGGITKRDSNIYGQPKWNHIKTIDEKLTKWGPYLMEFNNGLSQSYRYHKELVNLTTTEREDLINTTYIKHINTYPSGNPNMCPQTDPYYNIPDAQDVTYLQAAVFKKSASDLDNYFMIVNRRCIPGTDPCSGYRRVEIQLGGNNNKLNNFNNWKVVNLLNDSTVAVFDKRTLDTISLGWFNAGEAKLFKLTPVMMDGGTLINDEEVSANISFNCRGQVFNNGKNITINTGTTINFTSDSAGIEMNGGYFNCGVSVPDNPPHVVLQGKSGILWKGIQLQNCPIVHVTYTDFRNVNYTSNSLNYNNALNMINCANFFISKCNFTLDTKAGGVNMFFNFDNVKWSDYLVSYNNFTIPSGNTNDTLPQPFGITCTGSGVMPIRVDGNIFLNSAGIAAPLAIFMSGVTGGSVKNNTISNFTCSVSSSNSSVDFYGNTIFNNGPNGIGLFGNAGSAMYLSPNYKNYTGGGNNISMLGTNGINLKADNSGFYTDYYNVAGN